MRFAIGIAIVQCGWIARLALPDRFGKASFVVLAVCELLVPIWAEHAERTTWHPGHIAERYGLFTLIVLGESVLSATDAIQTAFDAGGARVGLLMLSAAGLCVVFAMWWLYFDRPGHELLSTASSGFVFGYGHFLIFASVAAVGAGLAVNVDVDQHVAHISARTGAFTVAVPVAIYLMSIWKLHHRLDQGASRTWGIPIAALVILLSPFLPSPITVIAVVLAALVVAVTLRRTSRRSDFGSPIGRRG
jgi:low temperature requirement protein LtrA